MRPQELDETQMVFGEVVEGAEFVSTLNLVARISNTEPRIAKTEIRNSKPGTTNRKKQEPEIINQKPSAMNRTLQTRTPNRFSCWVGTGLYHAAGSQRKHRRI